MVLIFNSYNFVIHFYRKKKAPLGQILRNFRLRMRTPHPVTFGHYGVTFHIVTSGQKTPLGRVLRSSRCTHTREPRRGSLPVAMVLVLLYYYYSKKKNVWIHFWACAEHNSGHFRSDPLPVTWLTSLPVKWFPVAPPPQILFELYPYTTEVILIIFAPALVLNWW